MEIKETKELIAGVKEAFKAGKEIKKIVEDGVSAGDLPAAFELVKAQSSKLEIYSEAVKDANLIKDELKDLSQAEIIEIFMELVKAVSEVEKV